MIDLNDEWLFVQLYGRGPGLILFPPEFIAK
jgi:hypothetical protein